MPDDAARRVFSKIIVAFPICRWPNRPWNKTSTTVRANVEQNFFYARSAKRAFITADAGLK
jgi:hypothetical protein